MAQYDGSIRIGTGIDKKGFQAGSKELEAGARRLAKSVSDSLGEGAKIALQKQTDAFIKLNQQYAAQEQKVKDLAGKLHDMQRQKVETAEFKELSKDLDKAKASLDRLYTSRDSYVELGKKTPPKLELDISDAERKIKILEADIKELISADKAYLPVDTSKIKQDIASAEQKQMQIYSALQNSAETLGLKIAQNVEKEEIHKKAIQEEAAEEERLAQIRENAVVGNRRIIETIERIKELEQEIADLKSVGVTEGYEDYDSRIQKLAELRQEVNDYNNGIDEVRASYRQLGEAATDALKKLSKSIYKYAISPFISLGKIAAKTFLGIGKSAKSSNNMLNKGFKAILKYGLGIRSLYILVNKLRTGIKEGFSNLYNDKNMAAFKAQVDSLKASLLTLKNSFAAAFRPIVEIAIPYIQKLIDYITSLLNVVGQFMAAITGQKNYTKAIKQTTAAIEDQNKAQNKQLSGLDKLNNLTSSSGGGGAGGGDDMFEEAPIEDKWKDMAQKLKDMWKESDFYDLGKSIGEWLKNALDSIPWNEIKEKARKLGKSLATLINGFIEVEGLGYSIGRTLAEAFNTAFEFLNAFVHELHWKSLGKFIADTLNGIFGNIDWELIRDTFVTGFKGLADAINSFIDNFHWDNISNTISNAINIIAETVYTFFSTVKWGELGKNLGEQLMESIKKIDWEQLGRAIGSVIQAALDFVTSFIRELDFGEVAQAVVDALKGFFETVDMGQLAEVIMAALTIKLAAKATVSAFKIAAGAILSALGGAINASTGAFSSIASSIVGGISSETEAAAGGISGLSGTLSSLAFNVGATAQVFDTLKNAMDWSKTQTGFKNAASDIKELNGQLVSGEITFNEYNKRIEESKQELDELTSSRFKIPGVEYDEDGWNTTFSGLKKYFYDLTNDISTFENAMETVNEGIILTDEQMQKLSQSTGFCNDDIESLTEGMIYLHPELAEIRKEFGLWDAYPETLSNIAQGVGLIKDGTVDAGKAFDEFREPMWNMTEDALAFFNQIQDGSVSVTDAHNSMKEQIVANNGEVSASIDVVEVDLSDHTAEWTTDMQIITDEHGNMVLDVTQGSDNLRDTFDSNNADINTSNDGMVHNFSDNADNITGKVSDIEGSLNENRGGFSSWAESVMGSLKSVWESARLWLGKAIDKIGELMSAIGGAVGSAFSGGGSVASAAAFSSPRAFRSLSQMASSYSAMPQMAALSKMEFPGYATGQVIPTSMKKHLAWLGDNNHETEVVSPLSTMKQANKEAILEVLSELGITGGNGRSTGGETFVFQVDGKTFFEVTRKEAQQYFSRTGRSPYPT